DTSRVYPSPPARAAAAMPILPPAPPRFSTITGLPSASPSALLISRAAMSVPPPAGKHTLMGVCRSGYSARAEEHVAPAAAIKIIAGSMRRRICLARDARHGALLLGVFYCPMIMAAISVAVMRARRGRRVRTNQIAQGAMTNNFDTIIIGGGAAGWVLVEPLAPGGGTNRRAAPGRPGNPRG